MVAKTDLPCLANYATIFSDGRILAACGKPEALAKAVGSAVAGI